MMCAGGGVRADGTSQAGVRRLRRPCRLLGVRPEGGGGSRHHDQKRCPPTHQSARQILDVDGVRGPLGVLADGPGFPLWPGSQAVEAAVSRRTCQPPSALDTR